MLVQSTFATNNTIGSQPYGIFINSNNTIYGANGQNNKILVWSSNNITVTVSMSTSNVTNPYSIFVSITGYIYVNNDNSTGQVDQWKLNTSNSSVAMYVGQVCYGLFVDINDTAYCSIRDLHQVVSKSLANISDPLITFVGTGCAGSAPDMLSSPYGIFVNINFDLYVADCGNNRIQKFLSEDLNGTTVVGNSTNAVNKPLSCPTGIILDGEDNLYIVDSGNNRIIRTISSNYECLLGCTTSPGSAAYQLSHPQNLAFDSYGNIYVTDRDNNRIQKFLVNQVCGKMIS